MATHLIDTDTNAGKKFVRKLENLKNELGMKPITKENMKQIKRLTKEQIKENSFLTTFLNKMKSGKGMKEMIDCLELKNVFIGDFGRKSGYVNYPIKEKYFRFVIHLGSPEIYYYDTDKKKDKQFPLLNGYGFVISPQESEEASLTVYSNPIRIINDNQVQKLITKIRPKDYKRTVLIYDFQYNLSLDLLDEVEEMLEKETNSQVVEETKEETNNQETNNQETNTQEIEETKEETNTQEIEETNTQVEETKEETNTQELI